MIWSIRFEIRAEKDFGKLDRTTQQRISIFLLKRLSENPKIHGKSLSGKRYAGLWRWRVGDYRLIGEMEEATHTLTIYHVGHRRDIYKH